MKHFLLFFLLLTCSGTLFSQANISISQGGTVAVNNGDFFYDAGGAAGNDGNTNYTITLVPAVAGESICLEFTMFNTYYDAGSLSSVPYGDSVGIYDGSSTAAKKIATLIGNYGAAWNSGTVPTPVGIGAGSGQGAVTTPGIFCSTNANGSLTITFNNTDAATSPGWAAKITTYKATGNPGCNINLTSSASSVCTGGSVNLTATGSVVSAPIDNNFNSSNVGTGWQSTSAATFTSNVCASPSPDGSVYLWMQNAACPRILASNSMNVTNGGNLSFEYRQASVNSAGSPCEAPDINMSGSTPEAVFVQYSINNGVTWNTMKVMFPSDWGCATCDNYPGIGYETKLWNKIVVPIPAAAQTASTQFRWIMPLCTSASTDNWGLDNVRISTPNNSTITITNVTAGGIVVGTSTTSPYSVSVSPTVTTTYRATITDGTSSCFSDYTVTVANPSASISYPGSPYSTSVSTAQPVTFSGTTGGTYSASPNTLIIDPSTGAITPQGSTPGNYMVTYTIAASGSCPVYTTTANLTITSPACGSCATPTCPIGTAVDYSDALATHTSHCNVTTIAGPQTYVSYHTVTIGTSGILGVVASSNNAGPAGCAATRVFKLYPSGSCGVVASAISPSVANANGSAYSNPEWYGLTPGATYILEITHTIPGGGCSITDHCQSYYSPNITTCGSCSSANCPVTGVANYPVRNFAAGSCNTWSPSVTATTLTNYYTVSTDASGFVGFIQQVQSGGGCLVTRSAVLRPLAGACNAATNISPSVTNANAVASGFNPEWYGLTPNTQYILVETVVVSNTCTLDQLCSNYYGCSSPSAPTASVTIQPTCATPTGTIVITAPTGASYLYSVNGTTYQASTSFTGLAPGNYNVTVKHGTTGCVSGATALTVNAVPGAPAAPTASVTVQPTCLVTTGTIVITAPTGANYQYSINGSTYQSGTTFSLLSPNTYNVTVKNTTTGCVSTATPLTVNAIPANPAAPTASVTVQPTCLVTTGTIVITAPTGANYQYSVDGTTYQSGTTFSLLAPNTYNVTVKNTTTGCVSTATPLTVNAIPANPAAPTASVTVQPTCLVTTGTIVVTAPTGANYQYSIDGTTYQSGTTFSLLAPNTYNVTVKNTTTGCVSTATPLTVNAIPSNPSAPTASVTVQPTCLVTTGTIVITAPTGANYQYSVDGTTYQSASTFSLLAPNTYNVTVKNTTTGCVSTATPLTVNAIPANPAAPTASVTVQPTCLVTTGTIVITAPTGANYQYSVDGTTYQSGTTFSLLAPNTYNVTVKNTTIGCVSTATPLTVNAVPANPAAPTTSVTVQPTCLVTTGTIVVTAPTGANYQYSVDGTTYQSGTTFSLLSPNTYNVTVKNTTTGCVSTATPLTVNAIPANPAAPTASVTVQPTCLVTTGTIVITAPTGANYQYSIDGTTYQSGTTFSLLAPNTYNVTVKNTTTGCLSTATPLTVNAIPSNPAAPTASVTVQPTCLVTTGTIVITAPTGANYQYSIDGTTYQSGTTFSLLAPNTYNVTVKNTTTGCLSTATTLTVNAIPANPSAPTASVTVQPTCFVETGTLVVTAPIGSNYQYSIDGISYLSSPTIPGVQSGLVNIIVKNVATGCISLPTQVTVNAQPAQSAPPSVLTPVVYCQNDRSGTLLANGTQLLWYTVASGGAGSINAPVPVTAVAGTASYYVTQTLAGLCESERAEIVVKVSPLPTAYAGGPTFEVNPNQAAIIPGSASGNGISILWSPAGFLYDPTVASPLVTLSEDKQFTMQVTSADGCVATDKVNIVVLSELKIPNVFSPNGDNINDTWVITHIEKYQDATLEIFNRYGQLLYSVTGYKNDWNGKYKGSPLPVATYYWIINSPKRNKKLSGSVTIIR